MSQIVGGALPPRSFPDLGQQGEESVSQGGADSRLQAQDSRSINLPGLGRGLNIEGTCHQTQEKEVQPDPLAPVRWLLGHKLSLDRAQVKEEQLEPWLARAHPRDRKWAPQAKL